ncbi:hypothetical protein [Polyangium spumosum]|uniref:Uncharacterized protein n=1 Tax=Polyangium spumosum TaxID=889282 RepID=A0A6N7PS73_9BACT|nr:hypothetical protein [Polyangium spumosum]MRG93075.1 hypothetical protein [Polyangium spumosum]
MVPRSLRTWFVIHFAADLLFAVPLLLFPGFFLALFGWTTVDPVTSRVVGAALVGIGGESLLGRNADLASFRTMLRLKILWSGAAVLGFALSLVQGAPWGTWIFLGIFMSFSGLWMYWSRRLSAIAARGASA